MAINLVSLVSQSLTPQLVSGMAHALGINEAVAQKLVAAAVPTILAALATAAAAPGGAQKVSDAISSSDPDVLTKLAAPRPPVGNTLVPERRQQVSWAASSAGAAYPASPGPSANIPALPEPATQSLLGAVTHAVIGTIGLQDPSNWSDPSAILSMLNSQKSAISAALPPETSPNSWALPDRSPALAAWLRCCARLKPLLPRSRALRLQRVRLPAQPPPSSAARSAQAAASRIPGLPAPSFSGFPMWAIILIVIVVLLAIWWYMSQNRGGRAGEDRPFVGPGRVALRRHAPAERVPELDCAHPVRVIDRAVACGVGGARR